MADIAAEASYWPQVQSMQVQFVQVHVGLSQLRGALPQLQSTQVHGSQVHAGFSQVVAMLMIGSLLWSARLMTISNAYPNVAARPAAARLRTDTVTLCADLFLGPKVIP